MQLTGAARRRPYNPVRKTSIFSQAAEEAAEADQRLRVGLSNELYAVDKSDAVMLLIAGDVWMCCHGDRPVSPRGGVWPNCSINSSWSNFSSFTPQQQQQRCPAIQEQRKVCATFCLVDFIDSAKYFSALPKTHFKMVMPSFGRLRCCSVARISTCLNEIFI